MSRSVFWPIALCALPAVPLLASGCFQLEPVSREAVRLESHVEDWRDQIIYQVLIDRFADGAPGNNQRVDPTSLARYQGGDWQGLIDRMDYIQALGVTSLWISPIVRNVDTDAGIDGYHGYWAQDLAELNPHFGDLATLRRLVQECHRRNISVVLDIVTNHMGQMFYYDINQNGRPDDNVYGGGPNNGFQNPGGMSSGITRVSEYDPDYNLRGPIQSYTSLGPAGPSPVVFLNMPAIFRVPPRADRACDPNVLLQNQPACNAWQAILASPEGYHRRGRIVDYDYDPADPNQPGPQTMLGDFPGGLKDVNTEDPRVRAAMVQAYARWVELLDLDGFRIDTLKHVEHDFWRDFGTNVRTRLASQGKRNFFMFGEAFDGNDRLIGSYTRPGEMDSVFYFSQKFRVFRDVFQCDSAGTDAVESLYNDRLRNYGTAPQPDGAGAPPTQLLVNFFDNHDVPRFMAGVFDEDPASCPSGRVDYANEDSVNRMRARMRAALTYLLTEDGIPCIYYGTELEFHGANDPANREVMFNQPNAFDTTGETFRHIARLTRIRRAYSALRRGGFQLRWTTPRRGGEQDAGILAFERRDGERAALVVINAHPGTESETSYDRMGGAPMTTGFVPGTQLVDVLAENGQTFTVGAGGSLVVRVGPWQAVILVPQADVQPLPQ